MRDDDIFLQIYDGPWFRRNCFPYVKNITIKMSLRTISVTKSFDLLRTSEYVLEIPKKTPSERIPEIVHFSLVRFLSISSSSFVLIHLESYGENEE